MCFTLLNELWIVHNMLSDSQIHTEKEKHGLIDTMERQIHECISIHSYFNFQLITVLVL